MATTTPATPDTAPVLTTLEANIGNNVNAAVATVKADATKIETTAKTWMQKHERIILTALVLLAGSWFGDHWLNVTAAHDKQQASIAVQQLDEQKSKDTQLAQQVSQLSQQYQVVVTQLTQANAALVTKVQTRTTVLHSQQQTDQTLPLPDLGNRWAQLASLAPADIAASTAGITVTDTGARQTVTQLEQVPVLQENLKDTQTIVDNQKDELSKADTLITGLDTQVGSLNLTVKDEETSCKAQVKSANASARSRWFKVGFVGGFVVGLVTGHKF